MSSHIHWQNHSMSPSDVAEQSSWALVNLSPGQRILGRCHNTPRTAVSHGCAVSCLSPHYLQMKEAVSARATGPILPRSSLCILSQVAVFSQVHILWLPWGPPVHWLLTPACGVGQAMALPAGGLCCCSLYAPSLGTLG